MEDRQTDSFILGRTHTHPDSISMAPPLRLPRLVTTTYWGFAKHRRDGQPAELSIRFDGNKNLARRALGVLWESAADASPPSSPGPSSAWPHMEATNEAIWSRACGRCSGCTTSAVMARRFNSCVRRAPDGVRSGSLGVFWDRGARCKNDIAFVGKNAGYLLSMRQPTLRELPH